MMYKQLIAWLALAPTLVVAASPDYTSRIQDLGRAQRDDTFLRPQDIQLYNNRLYVGGGSTNHLHPDEVWYYDLDDERWISDGRIHNEETAWFKILEDGLLYVVPTDPAGLGKTPITRRECSGWKTYFKDLPDNHIRNLHLHQGYWMLPFPNQGLRVSTNMLDWTDPHPASGTNAFCTFVSFRKTFYYINDGTWEFDATLSPIPFKPASVTIASHFTTPFKDVLLGATFNNFNAQIMSLDEDLITTSVDVSKGYQNWALKEGYISAFVIDTARGVARFALCKAANFNTGETTTYIYRSTDGKNWTEEFTFEYPHRLSTFEYARDALYFGVGGLSHEGSAHKHGHLLRIPLD